jgi:hypothetical protein
VILIQQTYETHGYGASLRSIRTVKPVGSDRVRARLKEHAACLQLDAKMAALLLCCRILSATLSLTVAASGPGPNIFTILGINGWR